MCNKFEEREKLATEKIQLLRTQIQQMTEADLVYRQQRLEKRRSFLESISKSARLCLAPLLEKADDDANKAIENLFKITWDASVNIIRSMFGNAATDAALKTIGPDGSGN